MPFQALPINSSALNDLSFLAPTPQTLGSFQAQAADTALRQQQSFTGFAEEGRRASEEERQSQRFASDQKQREIDSSLKSILFPLEVKERQMKLADLANTLDAHKFELGQQQLSAERAIAERQGQVTNFQRLRADPNAGVVGQNADEIAGGLKVAHALSVERSQNIDISAETELHTLKAQGAALGLFKGAAEMNRFMSDPAYSDEKSVEIRREMQNKQISDRAAGAELDLSSTYLGNGPDGNPQSLEAVLKNPANRLPNGNLLPSVQQRIATILTTREADKKQADVEALAKIKAQNSSAAEAADIRGKWNYTTQGLKNDGTLENTEKKNEGALERAVVRIDAKVDEIGLVGEEKREQMKLAAELLKTGKPLTEADKARPYLQVYASLMKKPGMTHDKAQALAKDYAQTINAAASGAYAPTPAATPGAPAAAPAPVVSGTPKVTTRAEFDALPSGSSFIGEDGMRYRKP